jgi:hypothetical protein
MLRVVRRRVARCFFSDQKSQFWFILEGLGIENFGIFWYFLSQFGVFGIICCTFVYIFPLCYVTTRKIWQPWLGVIGFTQKNNYRRKSVRIGILSYET